MKRRFSYPLLFAIIAGLTLCAHLLSAGDKPAESQKTVLIPLAEGFEDTEAIPMIAVLRRAGARVTIASVGDRTVTSAAGITVQADRRIDTCSDTTYDLIALHGGMPAATYLRDSPTLQKMLKDQRQNDRLYAAICASPVVVLGAHGLLAGKKATCYPSLVEKLADASAAGERVVADGNCITSQGPGTSLEFALKLVEALYGKEKADTLRKGYLVR